ncbi:MAG: hypothetical protein WCT28_04610 [Patescibacteria group bacterium]|jgi:hypothetical protein
MKLLLRLVLAFAVIYALALAASLLNHDQNVMGNPITVASYVLHGIIGFFHHMWDTVVYFGHTFMTNFHELSTAIPAKQHWAYTAGDYVLYGLFSLVNAVCKTLAFAFCEGNVMKTLLTVGGGFIFLVFLAPQFKKA